MKALPCALARIASLVLGLAFFVSCAAAQANRASITGTVTDPTGGLIVGVEVSARNVGTDVTTVAVTNGDGIYSIPNLPPGTYALTFRKEGFKEVIEPSVTLISTQVAGIDVTLRLGSTTENITVTTEAPVLDTESATVGTNMNGKVVTDLPLSIYGGGRFVENFAVALTPGYSPISSPYGAVVNGGQWFTKDYTVDGTTATASIRGDSMETGPSMEAVQELQAQTSGLDVASAITSGGVMGFTIKSGTNQLHGSVFGYGHNEFLDANSWTNDYYGDPKPEARAWDYGASIGGPIRKDKTFFFGTFERYTQNEFGLGGPSAVVPSAAMLGGNFSALLNTNVTLGTDSAGNTIYQGAIFNPQTGDVFPGNIIPTSDFSSVAQKIVAIYQKDYAPELPGLNANERQPNSNSPSQTPNQAVVKVDHNLTSKDRLSGSWIYNNRPRTLVDSTTVWEDGSDGGGPLSSARIQVVKSNEFRASEAHTFSPNLLNVLNVTYNWYYNESVPAETGTDWGSQFGFGNTGADNFPAISFGGTINGYGITGIGNTWQGYSTGATMITGDTITWTRGRHTMSFGGDFRAYELDTRSGSGALSFNFVPNTTDGGYTGQAGFGFASFLLGDVATANETTPFNLYGRRKSMTLFAQDSYKITPKLTLMGGLRWQYAWRYHEKYGHWANFDLSQIDPTYGYPGLLEFANGGGDSFEKKEYWDGLGPQIGFAYAPIRKWVFRGSFGLTLLPVSEPYFSGVAGGFAPGFQGTNIVNSPFDWDNGYPGVFQPGNKNVSPASLFPLVYVDPHALMPAFSDTINLGLEYELTPTLRVEVAYVGNRGHHLPDTALAWNEPSGTTFLSAVNQNPGINPYNDYVYCSNAGQPTGYTGISCPFAGFYGPALAAIAPSPQAANWAASYYYYYNINYVGLPIGQTSYNSMVIDLVKRGGHGWNTDLNYTYSRTRGDTYSAEQEDNGYYSPVQNFSNLSQAANTLSNYDITHIVKGFVTYELPFGRGKHWLSDSSSFVNRLVGGWSLNALVLYTSGQPFDVGVTNPYYPLYADFYPIFHTQGAVAVNPRNYQVNGPAVYLYPASVATSPIPSNPATAPVAFGPGSANTGALRCPGSANEDASVLKYLSFGADGRYQLSMRVEFYNLFNRHTYDILGCGGQGTTVGANNFGQVIGVNDNPRNGQFGVRLTF
jgi:hypothetical protein